MKRGLDAAIDQVEGRVRTLEALMAGLLDAPMGATGATGPGGHGRGTLRMRAGAEGAVTAENEFWTALAA